jgi:adenine-specific DNA-methyltransferase
MKTPRQYNITPARGQALLNFQGRRFPDKMDIFEAKLIEEVRNTKAKEKSLFEEESELNHDFRNLLIHGDCLSACAYLKSQNITVDLVYIDPPFASGANYAKKIYLRNGGKSELEAEDNTIGEEVMYGDIWQKEDYLNWLYERLLAIKDVMSETACIYVHLDWHIGHYVKILLDEIFGEENFRNEIIWKRTTSRAGSKFYNHIHDTIYFYSKSDSAIWNQLYSDYSDDYITQMFKYKDDNGRKWRETPLTAPGRTSGSSGETWKNINPNNIGQGRHWAIPGYIRKHLSKEAQENSIIALNELEKTGRIVWAKNGKGMPNFKQYIDDLEGVEIQSIWLDVNGSDIDYATQKPETLLERIIKASSNKEMTVADFFSGSGTCAKAAHDLNRRFIACDIGINAIQTTRDRLVKAGASFDILKIQDGLRLFRNPAQTTARLFGLIDSFKSRIELDLNEFWDGGIARTNGTYSPVKFSGIHDKLTKELLDMYLEEIYKLEDTTDAANEIIIIYAHKDIEIDQKYIDKQLNKTLLNIRLVSLDTLLGEKRDSLFTPDNAQIIMTKQDGKYKVEIKKFFSSYLKNKIDEYNAKKTKRGTIEQDLSKALTISKTGLELIEAVQFDTSLKKVWKSNPELEDKAGIKEKIKGIYLLNTDKFKMKIRNIAGDELIVESKDIKSKEGIVF